MRSKSDRLLNTWIKLIKPNPQQIGTRKWSLLGRCFSEMKIVNRSQTFDNPVQSVYANVMNEDVERAVNGIIKES